MLHVTYEAVGDFEPGRLASIDEDRGTVQVRVDKDATLKDVVRQLNVEILKFLSSSDWFQLWKDEIVCRDTPGRPLQVVYLLEKKVPNTVWIEEKRGLVSVYIDPVLDVEHFAAVMNPATRDFLSGGQWFQLFAGEIIDMSPETMSGV